MQSIVLDDNKPFLVIGSSGQEKELTQEIVNKYNSIAINRSLFDVDIIFRYDLTPTSTHPIGNLYLDKCRYFVTKSEYKKQYNGEKFRYFESEYKIISDKLPLLGAYRYTVVVVLNYIAIVKPQAEVYLVGIDHNKKGYNDPTVKRFIERYKEYLKIYQTDFNSKGWNLIYKELVK